MSSNSSEHGRQIPRRWVLASGLGLAASAALPIRGAVAAPKAAAEPADTTTDYRVGTFYFTQWNPELNPGLVTSGEAIYGPPDGVAPPWWDGPRQHVSAPGPWGYGPVAEREPLIGYYDDRTQSTIDQHILQASSRGLDHFAFYYYWKNGGGAERPGQEALHNFLTSPYNDLMDYFLYLIPDGGWPASDWNAYIVPNIVDFMSHASYMKTSDGRPILGFYGNFVGALGGETQLEQALTDLRNAVTGAGLGNPLLLVNAYRTLAPDITYGFDGFLPLNLAGIGLATGVPADYASSYPPAWETFVYNPGAGYESYENYLFVPGGLGAFDTRPWRGEAADNTSVETYVYADPSPTAFKAQLTNVKNYLDSHPRSMNMATFYCWNEWGEGGVIEPSSLWGFGNLNAIQDTFSLSNASYKSKVASDSLPDLDPAVRVEIAPDQAAIAAPESVNINVTVTNNSASALSSVQVCLNQSGWQLQSPSCVSFSLAVGAAHTAVFAVTAAAGAAQWAKNPVVATVTYGSSQATASSFVVVTPSVYALVQRPAGEPASYAPGTQLSLTVNVRNHSSSAQSGSYTITAPSGWQINSGGTGTFSLSAYSGGQWTNRIISAPLTVTIPASASAGTYNLQTSWNSDGGQIQSSTPFTVS